MTMEERNHVMAEWRSVAPGVNIKFDKKPVKKINVFITG